MKAHAKTAVRFATALVDYAFDKAHALLSPTLKTQLSPKDLQVRMESMWSGYAQGRPTRIHFDNEATMETWPGKMQGDVGWVYVSIVGDGFVEAVTVIVTDFDGQLLIRKIEWGRP